MELVAGCYEQVLFGFSVHPEPKASGSRQVTAGAPGGPGGVGGAASGLGSCTAEVNTEREVNTPSGFLGINGRIKLRRFKYRLAL